MGMSASQARLLNLQARQSNLEYQGQQINQERTILSQQCTTLYNSLLAMTVPTPPSTSDYTTIQYSGEDGATTFTIGTVKPHGDDQYVVEIQTSSVGDSLQQQYGSYAVTRAGQATRGEVVSSGEATVNELTGSENSYYVKVVDSKGTTDDTSDDTTTYVKVNTSNIDTYFSDKTGGTSGQKTLKTGSGTLTYSLIKESSAGSVSFVNPDAGAYEIGGRQAYSWTDAQTQFGKEAYDWGRYQTAIENTYSGDLSNITTDSFYVFQTISDTGVPELRFALKTDVESSDKYTNVSKFSENGKFTKSEEVSGCKLNFDVQGRINTISIPTTKDEDGNITSWRDITLTAETVTDNAAYQDAYNQYEYAQYEYDKKQQEINAKTEVIQQEDRNLELKLQRLDNERTQITTEIEAVEKVINENIEKSYKTFSG